jgi:hypothetical protein
MKLEAVEKKGKRGTHWFLQATTDVEFFLSQNPYISNDPSQL